MPVFIDTNMSELEEYIKNDFDKNKSAYISSSDIFSEITESYSNDIMDEAVEYLKSCITESMAETVNFSDSSSFNSVANEIMSMIKGNITTTKSAYDVNAYIDLWSPGCFRPSLDTSRFSGIDNILLLFDTGYNAPNAVMVHGLWRGNFVCGKPYRPETGFLKLGVEKFNSSGFAAINGLSAYMY